MAESGGYDTLEGAQRCAIERGNEILRLQAENAQLKLSISEERSAHEATKKALRGLCAWHDHSSLTGYPYASPVPPPCPSFNAVVVAIHAAIGQPPYKPEEMPEDD